MDEGSGVTQALGPATQSLTISQTIRQIRNALTDYIEATYHIGNSSLVRQRRRILDQRGVVYQDPYVESTTRYLSGQPFARLSLPAAAAELLAILTQSPASGAPLVHDPPYLHQAKALQLAINDHRSLAITTGTGSGKTESFLLPIFAKRLQVDDILIDAMRGRSTTWTRIRINLRHVPEDERPAEEPPDPDYDPWRGGWGSAPRGSRAPKTRSSS